MQGSCEYQFFKSFVLFRQGNKTQIYRLRSRRSNQQGWLNFFTLLQLHDLPLTARPVAKEDVAPSSKIFFCPFLSKNNNDLLQDNLN